VRLLERGAPTARSRCCTKKAGNQDSGLVDHEMVARVCNHPNLLVLLFSVKLNPNTSVARPWIPDGPQAGHGRSGL
jgi:hypothetical protein